MIFFKGWVHDFKEGVHDIKKMCSRYFIEVVHDILKKGLMIFYIRCS